MSSDDDHQGLTEYEVAREQRVQQNMLAMQGLGLTDAVKAITTDQEKLDEAKRKAAVERPAARQAVQATARAEAPTSGRWVQGAEWGAEAGVQPWCAAATALPAHEVCMVLALAFGPGRESRPGEVALSQHIGAATTRHATLPPCWVPAVGIATYAPCWVQGEEAGGL